MAVQEEQGASPEPRRRRRDLIPAVQRAYDLSALLYEHVNRFPRAQRGLLGRIVLDDALQMLVLLAVANRRADKRETLREASGRLDALRITLRLAKRLGYLSNSGYERLAEVSDEVGRMLGGWLKHERAVAERTAASDPAASSLEGAASAAPRPRGSPSTPLRTGAALHGDDKAGDGGSAAPVAPKRSGGVRYSMTSPTIERYLRVKLEHPNDIVFLTIGAFCQTFFEDAAFCHQALRLAVRDLAASSEPEKIPMCGIPRDKLERYATLLQRAGRTVHTE